MTLFTGTSAVSASQLAAQMAQVYEQAFVAQLSADIGDIPALHEPYRGELTALLEGGASTRQLGDTYFHGIVASHYDVLGADLSPHELTIRWGSSDILLDVNPHEHDAFYKPEKSALQPHEHLQSIKAKLEQVHDTEDRVLEVSAYSLSALERLLFYSNGGQITATPAMPFINGQWNQYGLFLVTNLYYTETGTFRFPSPSLLESGVRHFIDPAITLFFAPDLLPEADYNFLWSQNYRPITLATRPKEIHDSPDTDMASVAVHDVYHLVLNEKDE